MAVITEELDPPNSPTQSPPKPTAAPPSTSTPSATSTATNNPNPFHFWFYFTLIVSLITILFISLSCLSPKDPKSWFLSLPTNLRHHYSNGRTIKVQITPNQPQIEVFSIQEGPINSDNVLIVHGLGCTSYTFREIIKILGHKGIHAVSIDLPGSGFSDKSVVVEEEEKSVRPLEKVWEIYSDIKEKGIFWGFDQLIEQGYVNYEQNKDQIARRKSIKPIELGPEEMGRVLGQVIDSMGLSPVNLVLHDSALGLSANWISENSQFLRSVMLLDSSSNQTAFPLWVMEMPVIREIVLGFDYLFGKVVQNCCLKSRTGLDLNAHRVLLNGRDGRKAIVKMGKKLNLSFDLAEWGDLDQVKGLPMMLLWSEEWIEEGIQVAEALPQASFITHSGVRWPQEHNADELAQTIYNFVSSLPKTIRRNEEEPIPEHVQKMLDKAKTSGGHHDHDGHDHDHGHPHAAGYMDAYGLGQGWTVSQSGRGAGRFDLAAVG